MCEYACVVSTHLNRSFMMNLWQVLLAAPSMCIHEFGERWKEIHNDLSQFHHNWMILWCSSHEDAVHTCPAPIKTHMVKWFLILHDAINLKQMVRSVQMNPSRSKWAWVNPSVSKPVQVNPNEPKWVQVSPSESKLVQGGPCEPMRMQMHLKSNQTTNTESPLSKLVVPRMSLFLPETD